MGKVSEASTMAEGANKWPVWMKCRQRESGNGLCWVVTISYMTWKATYGHERVRFLS